MITVIVDNDIVIEVKFGLKSMLQEVFLVCVSCLMVKLGLINTSNTSWPHYTCLVIIIWIIFSNLSYLIRCWSVSKIWKVRI